MKLGFAAGYWSSGPPPGISGASPQRRALASIRYWTAEAYGSDCFTPLAWWGAKTSTINLGPRSRSYRRGRRRRRPMAAMTSTTPFRRADGLGLGASGPQVVVGWYGQPYPRPLECTCEYVQILRMIFARKKPVEFSGLYHGCRTPAAPGSASAEVDDPSVAHRHPRSTLAPRGRRTLRWRGGDRRWMAAIFFRRRATSSSTGARRGFALAGRASLRRDVRVSCDPPRHRRCRRGGCGGSCAADARAPIGGMGARTAELPFPVFARMGYEETCIRVQDLYLNGDKRGAIAAIPTSLVEDTALIGPLDKIRDDLAQWRETLVTTLLIGGLRRSWRWPPTCSRSAVGALARCLPPSICRCAAPL